MAIHDHTDVGRPAIELDVRGPGELHQGVGIVDQLEDRVVGLKVRDLYEVPAAAIVLTAHRELEKLVCTIHQYNFKGALESQWAYLCYAGLWLEPLRRDLDAYMDSVNGFVTGEVTVKLYRGTGSRSGAVYRRKIQEIRDRHPNQWRQLTVQVKETSLTGWTSNKRIADSFGHNAGGITMSVDMPVEDIFLSHDIWPKNSYMNEKEFVVFGSPARTVNLKDIDI